MGNEYLNQLVEAGVPAALAAKKIKFNFGISSNYFMEIAKFRAARMLWADIVKQYANRNARVRTARIQEPTALATVPARWWPMQKHPTSTFYFV